MLLASKRVSRRITVEGAGRLGHKQTVKFHWVENGAGKEGFVIGLDGAVRAYRNECRHIPMTMDWVENRFLSRDRCYIQCATHGALYEIATGLCVDGPPAGERLVSLDVEIVGDDVLVTVP